MKLQTFRLFLFSVTILVTETFFVRRVEKDLGKMLERLAYKGKLSRNLLLCETCNAVFDVLMDSRWQGASKKELEYLAKSICKTPIILAMSLTTTSCLGIVDLNIREILYVMDTRPKLRGKDFCSLGLQGKSCGGNFNKWKVNVKEGTTVPRKLGNRYKKPLKILHLTDIHYDPKYVPGSNTKCGDPLCCSGRNGFLGVFPWNQAGYWADYRGCDVPYYMIINFLQQLKEKYLDDVDLIYFTGDIISHRIWETTIPNNIEDIKFIMGLFRQYLGDKVVFPALGNHEPSPLNLYAPEIMKNTTFSTQWLFDLSANLWSYWLPKETQATIRAGGYYKTRTKGGLCIIALNNSPAYTLNYWLLVDDFDPYGQLQWLADTLQNAEDNGETCHILAHLPTGDSYTYTPWASEYRRIIERYANTVTGQFCGHTHYDEFSIYYTSEEPQKPVGVIFNGGSITPFENVNPNFRIFTSDPHNFELLDYDEYIMDVDEANKQRHISPNWTKLYSFKEEYKVKSLRAEDISKLVDDMITDKNLRMLYYKNKVRKARPSMEAGCNTACQKLSLANMVTSVYDDQRMANYVKDKIISDVFQWLT